MAIPALPFCRNVRPHQQTRSTAELRPQVTQDIVGIHRCTTGWRQRTLDGAHPGMLHELTGLQGQCTHAHAMLERGRLFPKGMAERWHHDHLIAQRHGALYERHMPVMHRVKTPTVDRIATHAQPPEIGTSAAIVGAAANPRQNFSALTVCFGVCASAKSWYNNSAVRPMATGVSGGN